MKYFDYIIIGAGIIGLSIAKTLKMGAPNASVLILEKEDAIGKHGSGRNSGAGTFYG